MTPNIKKKKKKKKPSHILTYSNLPSDYMASKWQKNKPFIDVVPIVVQLTSARWERYGDNYTTHHVLFPERPQKLFEWMCTISADQLGFLGTISHETLENKTKTEGSHETK